MGKLGWTLTELIKPCSHALMTLPVSAIFLLVTLRAQADAIATSQISFGGPGPFSGLSIDPDGGYGQFSANAEGSAFAQSGTTTQTDSGMAPSAYASDGLSQAFASASVPPSFGMSMTVGSSSAILGQASGSDQAQGTILIWDDNFMITGAPGGTVATEFKLDFSQLLSASTDAYGQSAQADTSVSLYLSGGGYKDTELLFSSWTLSVGPDQSESANFSDTIADGIGPFGIALQYDEPYQISLEVNTETSVCNGSSISTVPEPSVGALAIVATLAGFLFWRKRKGAHPAT